MKSIIVEGFDSTGKSSLIKELSKDLNMEVYVAGGPPKDFEAIRDKCSEQMGLTRKPTIYDRVTPISDQCYNPNSDHEGFFNHVIQYLMRDSIIIYCETEWEEGTHEVKEHDTQEHLAFIEENRDAIISRYRSLMNEISFQGFTVIHYDWRSYDVIQLVDDIRRLEEIRFTDGP